MTKKTKSTRAQQEPLEVVKIQQGRIAFHVIGKTPLLMNRLTNKVQRELLLPAKKKNKSEKETTLKHNPIEEFRSSPHRALAGPTLLAMPPTSFKGAMRSVAVDMPGSTKAQIGRNTYVEGDLVPVWGIPKLSMMVVRMADVRHTPDIRSRAILLEWAAIVPIVYTMPIITLNVVNTLFQAAGLICGVGDGRPEKGAMTFGQFEVVDDDDERFLEIVKKGGRKAQEAAMLRAEPDNAETEELLSWFNGEAKRRGFKIAS